MQQFWRTLLAVSGWVGILYLYPNIRDLPETYPSLAWVAEMERETALFIFTFVLVAYVAVIDARPFLRKHFTRHQFVAGNVEVRSFHFKAQDETLWRNTYWLPVFNTRNDSRQIKNLRAYIFAVVQWYPSSIGNDKKESIDLNNGERALIHLGDSLSREPLGVPEGEIEAPNATSFLKNAKNGHLFFTTGNSGFPVQTAGESCKPDDYPFFVHVLGEDVKSKLFRIVFTCADFRPKLTVPSKIGEPLEPHTIISEMTKP